MKKIYVLLTVGFLVLSGILISNYTQQGKKDFSSKVITSKDYWKKKYLEKKEKRKIGYSKASKPDMYSNYFKAITTRFDESESGYKMNYKTLELKKAQNNSLKLKNAKSCFTQKVKSGKAGHDFIQRGPANVGGRTRAIVVDPDDANKYTWYVGSATGGIWKTTDGAENWTNLSKDLTNLSVNALVMAPSKHNIIYAGTGESFPGGTYTIGNGIWKSVDRGESWTQLPSTATDKNFGYVNRLYVNPTNADIVIAATETGILKTTNGGTDWVKVYESFYGVEDLTAYTDARDTIFAGENQTGILRTTNGGNTWELQSNGLVSGNRYEVAVSPANRDVVFTSVSISGTKSFVYISKNNAETWTRFNDDANFLGGQGDYDNTIEAHPFVDSIVFVGGVDLWKIAFNRSPNGVLVDGKKRCIGDSYGNNGGGNGYDQAGGFGKSKIPGLHPDHHNITIIPLADDKYRIVNGNDGGIAVSEDKGQTFEQKPNNYITTQFYGMAKNPAANEYIGGMQDNGTWQSQSGENASSTSHYIFRAGGDGFECLWHASDPNKLLCSWYYNNLVRTVDGGNEWVAVSGITAEDGPFITRLSASKWHPDIVFAVGTDGVYKSTDFGDNWKIKKINPNWKGVTSQHNVEVSLSNPNIVWAGAAMNKVGGYEIYVSQDEGETYSSVNEYADRDMNAWISGIATHPSDPSTAYLLFSIPGYPKILKTTDLGQNWEDISGFGTANKSTNGFPDVITHCLQVMPHDPQTIWVGTEIGLFESNDGGQSWHANTEGLPNVSIYDMQIVGNQVVFATHGRGIWSVDIPEIDRVPEILEYKEVNDFVINLDMDVKVDYDYLEVYLNGKLTQTIQNPAQAPLTVPLTVDEAGLYSSYVIAYLGQESYKSNETEIELKDKIPSVIDFEIVNNDQLKLKMDLQVAYDYIEIYLNDEKYESIDKPTFGTINFDIFVEEAGAYNVYLVGYMFGTPFKSNSKDVEILTTHIELIQNEVEGFKIYPNPCRGEFNLQINNTKQYYTLDIFDLNGKKLYAKKDRNAGVNTISIENLRTGIYIVRLTLENEIQTQKIQVVN